MDRLDALRDLLDMHSVLLAKRDAISTSDQWNWAMAEGSRKQAEDTAHAEFRRLLYA